MVDRAGITAEEVTVTMGAKTTGGDIEEVTVDIEEVTVTMGAKTTGGEVRIVMRPHHG